MTNDNAKPMISLAEVRAALETYDSDLERFEPQQLTMRGIALRNFRQAIQPDDLRALLAEAAKALTTTLTVDPASAGQQEAGALGMFLTSDEGPLYCNGCGAFYHPYDGITHEANCPVNRFLEAMKALEE